MAQAPSSSPRCVHARLGGRGTNTAPSSHARAPPPPNAQPEYNGFTSAALKNAIDWLSRSGPEGVSPLKGKPFAVVSAGGGGGGMRAQRNIAAIAADFKMPQVGGEAPIAVKLYDGVQRFDPASGDLTDAAVQQQVGALVAQLSAAASAHKAAAAAAAAAAAPAQ